MRRFTNLFIIATVLIALLITSIFPAELVLASPLMVPDISPTKTDTIIGDDGDGKADPGEIIEYTVTIPNSGTDAIGINFTDIIDANTTLVGGSINVSPLAIADSYETIGNTLLEVGVAAGTNPAIHVTGDLFDNDVEFLGDAGTFTIISHTNPTNGTLVAFNDGTGTFSYLPNANFTGMDTFTYTLQDAGGLTDTATVSVNVVQRVWYVKNDAVAGGLGRSTDPFDTLVEAQTASSVGDTIYLFAGNGTTTGQNAGIILKSAQRLLGEGIALTMPVSVNGGANPTTLRVAGSMPLIDNTGGTGIAVSAPDVMNVEIRGLNMAGNTNAVDVTTTAANSGSFELANNVVRAAGQEGVDVNGGGSGTLTMSIHDNTITSTGNGIDIQRTAGSVTITALDDNVINGNTAGTGISVVGTGAPVLFDAVVGGSFDTVSGGITTIGQSGNGVGQSGMVLNNVQGDLNFTDLDIYADGGTALSVNGTTSNYTGSSGTRIVVTANASILSAAGGPAANLTDVAVNLVLSALSSTNSSTVGTSLVRTSGIFSAPVGSSITNANGTDFNIDADTSTVTYDGTITDTTGRLVSVTNATAGTKSFTGAISDTGSGTGTGISLTGNTGATISFSGGLTLSTGTNAAFTATGGGTVNVCDENPCNPGVTGGLANTLTTTTGTALNVANTTIGANNLEFRSISSSGGTGNGIILDTTGSSGGLKVVGDGTNTTVGGNGTGGTIANKGGADGNAAQGIGIYLNNTRNVVLRRMTINGTNQNYAIKGLLVSGFVLEYSTIAGTNGTAATLASPENYGEGAIYFGNATTNGLSGTVTFTNNNISGGRGRNLSIINTAAGTTTLTVKGNTFGAIQNFSDGGTSFAVEARVNSGVVINTTFGGTSAGEGNTLTSAVGDLVNFTGQDNTTMDIVMRNNILSNNHAQNIAGGGNLTLATKGTMTFQVTGNTMRDANGSAVTLFKASAGTGTPSMSGAFANNTIGVAGIANSGSATGNGIFVSAGGTGTMSYTISNNQIHQINGNAHIYADNTGGSYTANFTITGNLFDTPGGVFTGVAITNGAPTSTDTINVCAKIGGSTLAEKNTLNFSGNNAVYVYVAGAAAGHTFNLPGYAGGANLTNVENFIQGNNTGAFTTTADVQPNATANQYTGLGAGCNTPAVTAAPVFSQPVASANENPNNSQVMTEPSHVAELKQPSRDILSNASINLGSDKPLFAAYRAPVQSGETINVTIGDLPAGKTVTIKFRVTVDNPLPAGKIQILNQGNVTYTGGPGGGINTVDPSPNADPACAGSGTQTCTPVDRPDTTVVSITRDISSPTNASSVSWTVTFTTPISALTANNFTLVNVGLGGVPAITTVTSIGAAPSTQWTVAASTGSGNGTLGLNMANDAGLSHDVFVAPGSPNLLPFTGQVYTIERTVPTVTNVTSTTADGFYNVPDVISIQVVFSEAVNVTGTPQLTLETGATDRAVDYTSGSGTNTLTFTYTVQAGDTSSDLDYIVSGLSLNGGTIQDAATNTADLNLAAPGAAGSLGFNKAIVIDTTVPAVTSFTRFNPATSPTTADTLILRAAFSETVVGVDAADFAVNGTTTATITNVSPVSGSLYEITISGGDLSTFNGTVGLNFSGSMNIGDQAGNPLASSEPSTDETYMVDNTGPTVTINQAAGQNDPTANSSINFTVVFSEAVTDFDDAADVVLSGAAGATTTLITGGPSTYNVAISGMSSSGTVIATVPSGIASDGVNTNAASASTDNTVTYDVTQPTVTINQAAAQTDPAGGSPINFTVVFSEAVTDFDDAADVVLSGTAGATTTLITGGPTTYNVAVSGMATLGAVIASIPANAAFDAAANPNIASSSSDNSVLYSDNIPPVVLSSVLTDANPTSLVNVHFTVTFSESVTGVDVSDFSLTTTGVSGAAITAVSGSGSVYTVTVNTGSNIGTIHLDVLDDNTIQDALLNPLDGGYTSGETYTIISKAPIFADVPFSYWANSYIERFYNAGITSGCGTGPLIYCPDDNVTRAQMAVFVLRATHGVSFMPPPATGTVFGDVPATHWAAAWIEQFYIEGFTAGCGGGNYCPEQVETTRAQMAVFLLRAKHGTNYVPPAPSGVFGDVPVTYWAAAWIEQLAAEGITAGCGGGNYCPESSLTRAQMAVFLVRTLNLP